VGDAIVGAAPVENGRARVVVTFAAPSANEVPLRLRYAADAPWFEPGSDVIVTMPLKGPSPLRHLPVAVAGLAVIAWLVLGRLRRTKPPERPPASKKPEPRGEPRVEVLRPLPSRSGWTGRVIDAHEGTPVGNARVVIERPAFEQSTPIASTATAADGTFTLSAPNANEGDKLVVDGPLHAVLRQPLPPSGELQIAVVSRRRALLERLVAWARRRGRPFDVLPEPTPGHVRRAAGPDFGVARWADAVERAAYAGSVVDARAEAEVDRLAPQGHQAAVPPARESTQRLDHDNASTIVDPPRPEPEEE
jgi:hypothetical protein